MFVGVNSYPGKVNTHTKIYVNSVNLDTILVIVVVVIIISAKEILFLPAFVCL